MIEIEVLDALSDNYIYAAEYSPGAYFAVDPGAAKPVESLISQKNAKLTHIFATHHHYDHTGGISELRKTHNCKVIGPDSRRIHPIDTVIDNGSCFELGDIQVHCIATPGHTSTGICYFVTGDKLQAPVLFTGDTLFVCGCGRLLECDGQTMFQSLQKIAALPGETRIYPGHNYTEENLRFALTFEPGNLALQDKLDGIQQKDRFGHPTVPSTLAEEKRLNPFLKVKTWQQFAELRKKKDMF